MESRTLRVGMAAVAVAAAVGLFLVLREDDDGATSETTPATTTEQGADAPGSGDGSTGGREPEADDEPNPDREPAMPTIVVRGGEPVGGVAELTFRRGERIEFAVRSDVAEEVHLHGYDVSKDVAAGGRVRFDVPADIEGAFEAELEHSGVHLAEITVRP